MRSQTSPSGELREAESAEFFSVVSASSARFVTEVVGAGCALFTGVVVARSLGADGKGTVSVLSYLIALLAPASALGIGEAVARAVGQRFAASQDAVSGTLWLLRLTVPAGAVVLAGLTWGVFGDASVAHFPWVVVGVCFAFVATTVVNVFGLVLDGHGRVVQNSLIRLLVVLATAVATFVLVTGLRMSVLGAVVAMVVGWGIGAAVMLGATRQLGVRLRPARQRQFLGPAVRYGVPVQVSQLMVVAAARLDLFVVLALLGRSDAGQYSVALTAGQLVAYAPFALSVAAFPRLTRLEGAEADLFVARVARMSLVVALLTAAPLAALIPVALPALFGAGFHPAVEPGLLLVVAGVVGAVQWSLTRALAATGDPPAIMQSYAISVMAMVGLDFVLVLWLGLDGAALAAVVSSSVGVVLPVRRFIRKRGVALEELVPRVDDLVEVWHVAARALSAAAATVRRSDVRGLPR